jgi:pyruvate dehydrogenase E2 component (dihydrolipoamide acetyltransferase)
VTNDAWGSIAQQPMNGIRAKTVEHMTHCWTTIPHVTHFDKADITSLEEVRKKHSSKIADAGGKLTGMSFILKVVAEALKRFPKFNASIDLEGKQVLLKQYYNVGVAVETENGLLVPVLRDVDQKSIQQISIELPQLAAKARDRKLGLDEMQGGTFTITNLGGIGGESFTPIINAPEAAILGVSRSKVEAVHQNGQFAPRTMLPLSLSYDHRIIDGAEAARFTRWLCEALEQPWNLFLDGE